MKKVYIKPGCIGCGLCQDLVPEVFRVHNKSEVKDDAAFALHEAKIKEAACRCPMGVIICEDE